MFYGELKGTTTSMKVDGLMNLMKTYVLVIALASLVFELQESVSSLTFAYKQLQQFFVPPMDLDVFHHL
ncbi:hypothetical protein BC351_10645 [Paenibacillus ferrarius]|uniref:Uncharacterized protein n=1 Tax=Paenibacillus ferrarius TaxID=1469647 RepID=A0A1V4H9H8_9BACL|nr:hypothetical protein BC351_10645 [Paenibacillus ferrarius]